MYVRRYGSCVGVSDVPCLGRNSRSS
uniref:Uncharacterized protein n=1 Tax=Anopheles quadriannulatus TaxID=34691 RepID=A0A182XRF6_ANOQN